MLSQYKPTLKTEYLTEIRRGQTGTGLLIENDGHIITSCDAVKQMREDVERGSNFVCPDHFVVPAVFQKYGIKNANGRIYPENILRREVEKYINERVATHCALGALDHPSQSSLSGHDVAHNITELHWEGHTLVGELELHLSPGYKKYGICSTSGDQVANMLLSGYQIGVSSRGVGTVRSMPGGIVAVDEDFSLICWDVVLEPSTPGAFIGQHKEELQQYIEHNSTTENKSKIDERIVRINQILG